MERAKGSAKTTPQSAAAITAWQLLTTMVILFLLNDP